MKKIFITVIVIFLSFSVFGGTGNTDSLVQDNNAPAAPGTDSVAIKQLVALQVEAARYKEVQDSITLLQSKITPAVQHVNQQPVKEEVVLKPQPEKSLLEKTASLTAPVFRFIQLSDETAIKLFIIISFSLIVFSVVFIRRRKLNHKSSTKSNIKDGIRLIREEKVRDRKDANLSDVRQKLIGSTSSLHLSGDKISKSARKLNISKGELYLAARLKGQDMKKVSN